ncbi:MAG: GNAT family N-acetyltransferase [Ferruginibacter sp.]
MYSLIRTNSSNTDFRELVTLLDQDLAIRDGEEHGFYARFNSIAHLDQVVVMYENDYPVGCGAFKPYESGTAEIKRMYVRPAFRGKGYASSVLQELEKWAAELGYRACVLETGKKQPEAIRLYQKAGFALIPNYGQYAGVENSVCMRKEVSNKK